MPIIQVKITNYTHLYNKYQGLSFLPSGVNTRQYDHSPEAEMHCFYYNTYYGIKLRVVIINFVSLLCKHS